MSAESAHPLATIDLFHELDPAALGEVARRIRVRQFKPGQGVIGHQDDSHEICFILSGRLKVTLFSESGREIEFRELRSGDSFGELSAIDGELRSANVIAQTEACVGTMTAPDFLATLREHPEVAMGTLRKLTSLVRSLSERVQEQTEKVEVRICHELLRMARGAMINGTTALVRPSPKHLEIANRVNTHREAVSRLMSKLRRLGIVQRGGGEMLIKDVAGLERYARTLHGQ
jgi:CRP/FNR family cyclic AMP-dependent transcriptional regulator